MARWAEAARQPISMVGERTEHLLRSRAPSTRPLGIAAGEPVEPRAAGLTRAGIVREGIYVVAPTAARSMSASSLRRSGSIGFDAGAIRALRTRLMRAASLLHS